MAKSRRREDERGGKQKLDSEFSSSRLFLRVFASSRLIARRTKKFASREKSVDWNFCHPYIDEQKGGD
jgi:hypothetical protein